MNPQQDVSAVPVGVLQLLLRAFQLYFKSVYLSNKKENELNKHCWIDHVFVFDFT